MRILYTGGGTGGHLYPLVAIAKQLSKENREVEQYFIGPLGNTDRDHLRDSGVATHTITTGKLHRYVTIRLLGLLLIPIGILQALWHLFVIMPDVVFSKGGYGALPVLVAAWLYNIPIVLHESDTTPGLVTRQFAAVAKHVFVAFPETAAVLPGVSTTAVGHPIRATVLTGKTKRARSRWHIPASHPLLLIMGGSQGAQKINDVVLEILPRLLRQTSIIHITGLNDHDTVTSEAQTLLDDNQLHTAYRTAPFLNAQELADAYAAADVIVSRGGAGSVFEIAVAGKPSILIPLADGSRGEQRTNAQRYANTGAAIIVEEENLEGNLFLDAVINLLNDADRREQMSTAARQFARPDAAQKIAEYLLQFTQISN